MSRAPGLLVELAEVVLKNNVFTFGKKTLKQLRGTAIGTKFAPPYSILFMAGIKTLPLLAVHRRYLQHLGTWRRKTKEIYRCA